MVAVDIRFVFGREHDRLAIEDGARRAAAIQLGKHLRARLGQDQSHATYLFL
ncbi:hypothetical protein D3C87_2003830 [compost metagenome]